MFEFPMKSERREEAHAKEANGRSFSAAAKVGEQPGARPRKGHQSPRKAFGTTSTRLSTSETQYTPDKTTLSRGKTNKN